MPHDNWKFIKDNEIEQVTVSTWVVRSYEGPYYELLLSMYKRLLQEQRLRQRYSTFQFIITSLKNELQNWSGHGLTGLTGSYSPVKFMCWLTLLNVNLTYFYFHDAQEIFYIHSSGSLLNDGEKPKTFVSIM